ncbi:MAG TPA: hypothetical protein DEO84_01985 [candidate division Zixibacteria bacterium]|nr:hypothetical protein [candidate division Zixibacteria bacterium]HBZ00068.1 hypothetical protein [candidate division Zixibacteria bacterium]
MKKTLLIVMLALVPAVVYGQIYLDEHFTGNFPPAGWTVDLHPQNWIASASNRAGGSPPESEFKWEPQFSSGYSRLISPHLNLTGTTTLKIQFTQYVDWFASSFTIGVATRHSNGSWHVVYSVSPGADIGPAVVSTTISNGDVGASDFQICWYFNGDTFNINFWKFDDILLYQPRAHDMRTSDIIVNSQYSQGATLTPGATVVNFGLNADTCMAKCEIFEGQNLFYADTLFDIALPAGQSSMVNFDSLIIPTANVVYQVRATTIMPGDMDLSNDSLSEFFNTYTTPRNMVMTELGTGTWCTYCPGATMGAEDMIGAGFNTAIVEYHMHSTTAPDPFENSFSVARVGYYGFSFSDFPTAVFDGILQHVGGNHSVSLFPIYQPLYQTRADLKSAFSLGITGSHIGDSLHVQVQVSKNAPIIYQNMVLHLALTESNISYSWQDQDHCSFVERIMAPDEIGAPLDFTSGDLQIFNFDFAVDTSWDMANCELAAWVQNRPDKECLQGAKVSVTGLQGVDDDAVALPTETKLLGNYPNPFNPSTTIEFALSKPSDVKLDVFNLLGQKVTTLINSRMEAGNHSVIWNGRDANGNSVASGAYFYKLNTNDYASTRKMVLAK